MQDKCYKLHHCCSYKWWWWYYPYCGYVYYSDYYYYYYYDHHHHHHHYYNEFIEILPKLDLFLYFSNKFINFVTTYKIQWDYMFISSMWRENPVGSVSVFPLQVYKEAILKICNKIFCVIFRGSMQFVKWNKRRQSLILTISFYFTI